MDRWSGILKVSLNPNSGVFFKVAASLCLSPSSQTLTVPSVNAIFFTGDRVEGTGNPVIERLSDPRKIADILVSKLGPSLNAWVIEASTFNGPFAVYKELIPSVNSFGEPKYYSPDGFPASISTVSILQKCLNEVKKLVNGGHQEPPVAGLPASSRNPPKTIILGFSKGGTVLNQLLTELAYMKHESPTVDTKEQVEGKSPECFSEIQIIPNSKDTLLKSISEIHYVDVGLNSCGAYLTDISVIEKITERVLLGAAGIRFTLHGTPRQWCDSRRPWIKNEKNILLQLLEVAAQKTAGDIQISERLYFADKIPDLQMHFDIIESLDVCCFNVLSAVAPKTAKLIP